MKNHYYSYKNHYYYAVIVVLLFVIAVVVAVPAVNTKSHQLRDLLDLKISDFDEFTLKLRNEHKYEYDSDRKPFAGKIISDYEVEMPPSHKAYIKYDNFPNVGVFKFKFDVKWVTSGPITVKIALAGVEIAHVEDLHLPENADKKFTVHFNRKTDALDFEIDGNFVSSKQLDFHYPHGDIVSIELEIITSDDLCIKVGNFQILSNYDSLPILRNCSGLTWFEAQKHCATDNLLLGSVHRVLHIANLLKHHHHPLHKKVWIGGFSKNSEKFWVDGSDPVLLPTPSHGKDLQCASLIYDNDSHNYEIKYESCTNTYDTILCQTKALLLIPTEHRLTFTESREKAHQMGLELATLINDNHENQAMMWLFAFNSNKDSDDRETVWTGTHYFAGKLANADGSPILSPSLPENTVDHHNSAKKICVKLVNNNNDKIYGYQYLDECNDFRGVHGFLAHSRYITILPENDFTYENAISVCNSISGRYLPIIENPHQDRVYRDLSCGFPSYLDLVRVGSSHKFQWNHDGPEIPLHPSKKYFQNYENWNSISNHGFDDNNYVISTNGGWGVVKGKDASDFGLVVCDVQNCGNGLLDHRETCDASPYNFSNYHCCRRDRCTTRPGCVAYDYYRYKECEKACGSDTCFDIPSYCYSHRGSCTCNKNKIVRNNITTTAMTTANTTSLIRINYNGEIEFNFIDTYHCKLCTGDCCSNVPIGNICPLYENPFSVSAGDGCCVCKEKPTVETNLLSVAPDRDSCYPPGSIGRGYVTCDDETNKYCFCGYNIYGYILPPEAANCSSSVRAVSCPQTTCPLGTTSVFVNPPDPRNGDCCATYRCDVSLSSNPSPIGPPAVPPFSIAPSNDECYNTNEYSYSCGDSMGIALCADGAMFCACSAYSLYLIPPNACSTLAAGVSIVPCKKIPRDFCEDGEIIQELPANPANGSCCPTFKCVKKKYQVKFPVNYVNNYTDKFFDILGDEYLYQSQKTNYHDSDYHNNNNYYGNSNNTYGIYNNSNNNNNGSDSYVISAPSGDLINCVPSNAYYSCDNDQTHFCSCIKDGRLVIPDEFYAQCKDAQSGVAVPCPVPPQCPIDSYLILTQRAIPANGTCCNTYLCKSRCDGPCSSDIDCESGLTCTNGYCGVNRCKDGTSGCTGGCEYLGGCKYKCTCGSGDTSSNSHDPFLVNLAVKLEQGYDTPAKPFECRCPGGTRMVFDMQGNSMCIDVDECKMCKHNSSAEICTRTPSMTFLNSFCHPTTTCTNVELKPPFDASSIYPEAYGFTCCQCPHPYVDVGLEYALYLKSKGMVNKHMLDYAQGRNCARPASDCDKYGAENSLCYIGQHSKPKKFGMCHDGECVACTKKNLTPKFCEKKGKAFPLYSAINPGAVCNISAANYEFCLCNNVERVMCADGVVTCSGTCCVNGYNACSCTSRACRV